MLRSNLRPALVVCVAGAFTALLATRPALAQRADGRSKDRETKAETPDGTALTEDQQKAQQHFQRAKELYQAGSYREAVSELEAARALDPKAKDLVFNLGVVHEKLAKYDEALRWFRTYLEMDGVTAQERTKAEGFIKRIEGAKRSAPTEAPPNGTTPPKDPSPPPENETPARGRIDALTIAAGSLALVGFGVGTYFGISAVATRPNDFVTGRDGSYATLQERTDDAHTAAVIADVGFGVGIVATLVTAYLYFGRTKDPVVTAVHPRPRALTPSISWNDRGGAITLGGVFP